jgi:hypothetical protein
MACTSPGLGLNAVRLVPKPFGLRYRSRGNAVRYLRANGFNRTVLGQVLYSYFSMQKTWANVKDNVMRDVSSLKRDAAIGGKHAGRSLQIQVFNQPAAHKKRAQAAMK